MCKKICDATMIFLRLICLKEGCTKMCVMENYGIKDVCTPKMIKSWAIQVQPCLTSVSDTCLLLRSICTSLSLQQSSGLGSHLST